MPLSKIDLDEVAKASDGFSGAEIEQVVVSALYAVRDNDEINTQHILDGIKSTRPLSVVMAEKIERLRQWSSNRTVTVD